MESTKNEVEVKMTMEEVIREVFDEDEDEVMDKEFVSNYIYA